MLRFLRPWYCKGAWEAVPKLASLEVIDSGCEVIRDCDDAFVVWGEAHGIDSTSVPA